MEKHYFIRLDLDRDFAVMYGTSDDCVHIRSFKWLWTAKVRAWFENRNLTRLREFNDRQSELFSGGSLELSHEHTPACDKTTGPAKAADETQVLDGN